MITGEGEKKITKLLKSDKKEGGEKSERNGQMKMKRKREKREFLWPRVLGLL